MWDLSLWESYPIQDTLNLKLAKITEIKEILSAFRAVMSSQAKFLKCGLKKSVVQYEYTQVWSESDNGTNGTSSNIAKSDNSTKCTYILIRKCQWYKVLILNHS